jgi:hypothetical protein
MFKHTNDLFNDISVSEQEIDDWITREVPHMSDLKSSRSYYAKWWNIARQ